MNEGEKKGADDEEISKMRLLGGKKCRATEEGSKKIGCIMGPKKDA